MDEKTARKYRDGEGLPSEGGSPRDWRTRPDPFAEVWPEVQARLEAEPRLRAFTLFGWLQECYPGRFPDSQRRTFERRVRDWRGLHGPEPNSHVSADARSGRTGGVGLHEHESLWASRSTANRSTTCCITSRSRTRTGSSRRSASPNRSRPSAADSSKPFGSWAACRGGIAATASECGGQQPFGRSRVSWAVPRPDGLLPGRAAADQCPPGA